MQIVLIETYAPHDTAVAELAANARGAAGQMARRGHDVRYVQTIFVPRDETCFHLFEAASLEALTAATRATALRSGRVAGVVATVSAEDANELEERRGMST